MFSAYNVLFTMSGVIMGVAARWAWLSGAEVGVSVCVAPLVTDVNMPMTSAGSKTRGARSKLADMGPHQ